MPNDQEQPGQAELHSKKRPDKLELTSEQIDAIKAFDQATSGDAPEPDESKTEGDKSAAGDKDMTAFAEQWLENLEGDPVHLLQNRFQLEEYRAIQQHPPSAVPYEPRPW